MSITPYKWGWGETSAAIAFWGFVGGEGVPVPATSAVISGGIVYSTRKSREKREENEILLFIKEFLRGR